MNVSITEIEGGLVQGILAEYILAKIMRV